MNIFHAVVLGIIQGLTEFLPISSSAHLILAPWFFHWPDPGLGFDVALHWGTLFAVLGYFRRDILLIVRGFWHSLFKSSRDLQNNIYQKLAWLLIIASLPGAIIGKLLEAKAETAFRNPLLVAGTMGVMGVVLWAADQAGKRVKNLDHISYGESILIGLSQALAIVPGVSRSGSTISTGLFLGFKREDIAKFSFLMSIPIIFGAGLLKLKDFNVGVTPAELIAGFLSSAVFGLVAIKFLLDYLRKRGFGLFVWYRLALAAIIVLVYFSRGH